MDPTCIRNDASRPFVAADEYLVVMPSLSHAQKGNCLTLLNPFILGGPSSTVDILESVLSKWPSGRNPEIPIGSEFGEREYFVVVTNA